MTSPQATPDAAAPAPLARRVARRAWRLREQLDLRARSRRLNILQHEMGIMPPSVNAVIVADKVATQHDLEIAERLLAAHRAAARAAPQAQQPAERDDLWTKIAARQSRFASILEGGDAAELASYLCNVSRHDASEGITQGEHEYARITSDRAHRRFIALMALDKLVSLAEAVGALPVENPEQGSWGTTARSRPAELVERISARLGTEITPPDVDGGLLKIDTGRGLFGERDANAIYTAHLLRETTRGLLGPRICEIGGGSGRVAYWSRRFGLTSYTIVDLPHVNVVQGYYALKSLPADEIVLYGEEPAGASAGCLQILPAHAVEELDGSRFDLVLNQDSFPEMSPATVADYLRWIAARCDGWLMSINHESKPTHGAFEHVSVPEMTSAHGGFELGYRFPYWLRRGYVVELNRIRR